MEYIDITGKAHTSIINNNYIVTDYQKYFQPRQITVQFFVPEIKKVIFHDPATIIIWMDNKKTVVKVHDEPYDKEKGFAMCVLKRLYGDFYHKVLKEALKDDTD